MISPELDLGEKHACPGCFTLFYDLNAGEPVCPSCGESTSHGKEGPTPAPKETEAASADPAETPGEAEAEAFEEEDDDGGGEDTEALGTVKPAADPTADEETEEE